MSEKYVYRITQPDNDIAIRARISKEAADLLDYLSEEGWFAEVTYIEREDDNEILEF